MRSQADRESGSFLPFYVTICAEVIALDNSSTEPARLQVVLSLVQNCYPARLLGRTKFQKR